jgi:CRP/FNR family transcriptional regulator, nitrogen oxide reductase regulator
MSDPAPVRLLQQVALFRGLDAVELSAVARAARPLERERGMYFFQQGTKADIFFVLQRGQVKLTQSTPEGQKVLLGFVGAGQAFGPAALDGQTYPVSAQAVRWCKVLAWRGPTMAGLMEKHPRIALNAVHDLTVAVFELQQRYRELATERVERRIAHALIRLAAQAGWKTDEGVLIDMPLSHQDLAEMTATTLYTVSRVLRAWKKDGLVDIGRQRVAIIEPDGLMAIAADLPARNGIRPAR